MDQQYVKGWYEIRDQKIYIWEGVLAMWKKLNSITFFKIMETEIYEIHIELNEEDAIKEIKSDGYWQCAELRGKTSADTRFLCHSTSVEHALQILKVLPSTIVKMSIRLDPDPYRNWPKSKIENRIAEWRRLGSKFTDSCIIIRDSEMLN